MPDERTIDGSSALALETAEGWLDLLLEPAGWPGSERLRAGAERVDIDGRVVLVAAIDDLIAMKPTAGRPQDLADLAELELMRALEERDARQRLYRLQPADSPNRGVR